MRPAMHSTLKHRALSLLSVLVLGGCASYGPAYEPYQTGDYYDQYNPAYSSYPDHPGYYGYPYQPGYYGYQGFYGPSLYFGTSRGSGGIGVGTTFGW